ncbi:MAG TPA: SDR family oxidoreductase, partial [Polyangiaceae bacterium]|nr:SDR family oxidoreductase [Polyangiaceae bacterium]
MTGATGFIGRHLVFQLLARSDLRLTLVVRARSLPEASERIEACLAEVADELGASQAGRLRDSLSVVVGDVREPLCGLAPGLINDLAIDELWHLAASLSFAESSAAETHEHNVDGTRHALELAAAARAKRFVHVSTAYVCGSAIGQIREDLQPLAG